MTPGSSLFHGGFSAFSHVFICLNCDLCGYVNGTVDAAAGRPGGRLWSIS